MKKISRISLLFIVIATLITLIAQDIFIWNTTRDFLYSETRKELEKNASLARAIIDLNTFQAGDRHALKIVADEIKERIGLRVTLMNFSGTVISDSEIPLEDLDKVENHLQRPEVQEALHSGAGLATRISATIGKELIYYCETLKKENQIIGFFRIAIFAPDFQPKMDFLKYLIILMNLIIIVIIIIGTLTYGKWIAHQFQGIRIPLQKQKDSPVFKSIPRQKYEEFDSLAIDINILGEKLENYKEKYFTQRKQLQTIFDSLDEGVAAFNQNGVAILHNTRFRKLFGINPDYESGITFDDCVHFPKLIKDVKEFLKSRKAIEKRAQSFKGRYYDYQILPIRVNEKPSTGFLLTLADVTQLQQLETIRQDFVANVSHEFKTPLTSIRGYAETLLSGMAEKKKIRHKFLKKIEKQTIYLENLVTDLLQLSKVEKKKITDLVKLNPLPIIEKIIADLEPILEEKGISFHKEIPKQDKKIRIIANANFIQTIVANLINNAIQYNRPDGSIWFRLKKKKNKVYIEVEDTGLGIPEAERERIFERFYRVEEARSLYPEGSGLGLSIVKHSVEMLSGKFGVKSEIGKGSLFWVEIPLIK